MAIKLPSSLLNTRPLQAVAGTVARANEAVQQAVEGAAAKVGDVFDVAGPASRAWEGVARPTASLVPETVKSLLERFDLETARRILEKLHPPRIEDVEGDRLVSQTQGFRESLAEVRRLESALAGLPEGDPRADALKEQLGAAEARLTSLSGYSAQTAPRPGALWLDPQFLHRELPEGRLSADTFPTGNPVTSPPAPLDFLFGSGKGRGMRTFTLDDGPSALATRPRGVTGAEAYKAEVARNRAAAGMPVQDGEPVGVHATFEGGGGKGKRFGAALAEMYALGVVPTSMSGSSAGAIAAALAATGASPAELNAFVTDPRLQQFFDLDLKPDDGGLFNGNVAFDTIDQELRRLTGITDRPVTFADLKVPLKLYAAKASDSAPEPGSEDLSKVENRLFVFSQETTPDTPVVLAVRASMAIPGVFDPVQMVDPTTGRKVHLVDGGALDNLPVGNEHGLPEVGLSLLERNANHPAAGENTASRGPLTAGNLDTTSVVWNAFNGYSLMKEAGGGADDFRNRTQPKAGQFMLSLPVWDLKDPSRANSTLGFGYDKDVDPALDMQTRELTRDFLRNTLDALRTPGASGTNVTARLPARVRFEVPVTVDGRPGTARYEGGDKVRLTDAQGESREVKLGQQAIEAMYLDHLAFGDLTAQLSHELSKRVGGPLDWLF